MPRPPALAGVAATSGGGAAVSGTWAARGSCSSARDADPDDRRRRRLRDGPAARSGLAAEAGGAATAGGAGRGPSLPTSIVSGDRSPATPAKRAISVSVMVRRRVVHSPPRGRSSKESGSTSGKRYRSNSEIAALTYPDFDGTGGHPAHRLGSSRRRLHPPDAVADAPPRHGARARGRAGGRDRRPRPGGAPPGDRLGRQLVARPGGGPERGPHARRPDHGRGRRGDVPGPAG